MLSMCGLSRKGQGKSVEPGLTIVDGCRVGGARGEHAANGGVVQHEGEGAVRGVHVPEPLAQRGDAAARVRGGIRGGGGVVRGEDHGSRDVAVGGDGENDSVVLYGIEAGVGDDVQASAVHGAGSQRGRLGAAEQRQRGVPERTKRGAGEHERSVLLQVWCREKKVKRGRGRYSAYRPQRIEAATVAKDASGRHTEPAHNGA